MKKILTLLALFAFASVANTANTAAATSDWAVTDNTRLRLITQAEAVGDTPQVTLGLHFKLNDHWKIYWRSPGDAGFPPSVEWDGPDNVKAEDCRCRPP